MLAGQGLLFGYVLEITVTCLLLADDSSQSL